MYNKIIVDEGVDVIPPLNARDKENKINDDLKDAGLRVFYKLDKVKGNNWEYTLVFCEISSKEKFNCAWEIINKHYQDWLRRI
jgi:hypothetical protein